MAGLVSLLNSQSVTPKKSPSSQKRPVPQDPLSLGGSACQKLPLSAGLCPCDQRHWPLVVKVFFFPPQCVFGNYSPLLLRLGISVLLSFFASPQLLLRKMDLHLTIMIFSLNQPLSPLGLPGGPSLPAKSRKAKVFGHETNRSRAQFAVANNKPAATPFFFFPEKSTQTRPMLMVTARV